MNSMLLLTFSLVLPTMTSSDLVLEGDYVEARTCDVYTGPCFANAEVNETGKEATVGWKVRSGAFDGVDLTGLSVVALVRANATIGDPYGAPTPSRSMILVDDAASDREQRALVGFARQQLGDFAGTTESVQRLPIELKTGCCAEKGCATLTAGDLVSLETRCVDDGDHVCGNEEVFYPPMTSDVDAIPAVLTDHAVIAEPLGVKFQEAGSRGAFTGTFEVVTADAEKSAKPPKYSLKAIPTPEGVEEPTLPKEIPAAFAGLLDPKGIRVEVKGKLLYDVWLRRELTLARPARNEMSSEFGVLPLGEFVGVIRSNGREVDYRESPIDKGFFAMRYGMQPNDGDHLGTAPTRDFLVLTGFEDDEDTAPVSDMDDLAELSLMASSTDHPMILYLLKPEGEASAAARIVEHDEREEWILELTVSGRATDEEKAKSLRVGVVLIGISEHY